MQERRHQLLFEAIAGKGQPDARAGNLQYVRDHRLRGQRLRGLGLDGVEEGLLLALGFLRNVHR